MGLLSLTRRVGQDAAVAVTGGAAALSGAATGAAEGAVNGATQGASHARGSGPRSPALAALVVAAIGVTGVLEWPVLALGSVAALVLGQRRNKPAITPISSKAAPPPPQANQPHRPPQSGTGPARTDTPSRPAVG